MNVGEFKKYLEQFKVPDETVLVVRGNDHCYLTAAVIGGTGLHHRYNGWTEDHGDEVTPEKEYGKRKGILIFE